MERFEEFLVFVGFFIIGSVIFSSFTYSFLGFLVGVLCLFLGFRVFRVFLGSGGLGSFGGLEGSFGGSVFGRCLIMRFFLCINRG